jgi:hypothetical protein
MNLSDTTEWRQKEQHAVKDYDLFTRSSKIYPERYVLFFWIGPQESSKELPTIVIVKVFEEQKEDDDGFSSSKSHDYCILYGMRALRQTFDETLHCSAVRAESIRSHSSQ